MTDSKKSLLLFLIILAFAGAAAGGVYYAAIELPQQKTPGDNSPCNAACSNYYNCLSTCEVVCQ